MFWRQPWKPLIIYSIVKNFLGHRPEPFLLLRFAQDFGAHYTNSLWFLSQGASFPNGSISLFVCLSVCLSDFSANIRCSRYVSQCWICFVILFNFRAWIWTSRYIPDSAWSTFSLHFIDFPGRCSQGRKHTSRCQSSSKRRCHC